MAGDCRDDADVVAVLERRGLAFEEPDVFLVDVHVYEAANFAVLADEPFLDAGELALEFIDRRADGGGVDLDGFLLVGELPERSGDSYCCCHD
jgi:hypothetical protein